MASRLAIPELTLKGKEVTLCSTLKEIIDIIWCHHHLRKNDKSFDISDQRLKLSINVKKKSEKIHENLDVFTVKVKCNQEVPFMSTLKDIHACKLSQFMGQMQTHEQESHLAIRMTSGVDPSCTRTFVLWASPGEGPECSLQIQDEILSTRSQLDDDILVLQLRVFMKSSSMVKQVQSVTSLLCCIKMVNPWVDLCLSVDGIQGVDVQLCQNTYLPNGGQLLSADPFVYSHNNLWTDTDGRVADMSLVTTVQVSSDQVPGPASQGVSAALVFVPKIWKNSQSPNKGTMLREKYGEMFVQVFDDNRLPIDMVQFSKCFHISPLGLIPWDDFQSVVKLNGTCTPYQTGCCVRIPPNPHLPQAVQRCDRFNLWMCLVLEHAMDPWDSKHTNTLDCLMKSANQSFQRFFRPDPQEQTQVVSQHKGVSVSNGERENVHKWIGDITSSISDIYIKSTYMDFRSEVAQILPVHTCVSIKSCLQELMENILLTNECPGNIEPSCQVAASPANEENEWKEFYQSQLSSVDQCENGRMSPDSLEDEVVDREWDQMVRDSGMDIQVDDDQNDQNDQDDLDDLSIYQTVTPFHPPRPFVSCQVDSTRVPFQTRAKPFVADGSGHLVDAGCTGQDMSTGDMVGMGEGFGHNDINGGRSDPSVLSCVIVDHGHVTKTYGHDGDVFGHGGTNSGHSDHSLDYGHVNKTCGHDRDEFEDSNGMLENNVRVGCVSGGPIHNGFEHNSHWGCIDDCGDGQALVVMTNHDSEKQKTGYGGIETATLNMGLVSSEHGLGLRVIRGERLDEDVPSVTVMDVPALEDGVCGQSLDGDNRSACGARSQCMDSCCGECPGLVTDIGPSRQVSDDDWFDKEEFDNWCAQMEK